MTKKIAAVLLVVAFGICAFAGAADEGRFFPVGVWFYWRGNVPDDDAQAQAVLDKMFAKVRSAGMNVVVADGIVEQNAQPVLDAAQRHGLKVILSCRFLTQKRRRRGQPPPDEAAIHERIKAYLPKVDGHPALYFHYTYDCPRQAQTAYLRGINQLFAKLAPSHPTFMAYFRNLPEIANGSNAPTLSWDNFPIGSENPPGVLVNYRYPGAMDHEREMERIHDKTPGLRRLMLIQAFDSPGRLRYPSAAELRVQINAAFLAGWTDGILFYRFHSRAGKRPRKGMVDAQMRWQVCSADELKQICEKTRKIGQHLAESKRRPAALLAVPPQLRVAEFQKGQARYALVMNRSATERFDGEAVTARARTRRRTPWQKLSAVENVLTQQRHSIAGKAATRIRVALDAGDAVLFRFELQDKP